MSEPTEREYLEGLRYEDKFPEDRTRTFARPASVRVCSDDPNPSGLCCCGCGEKTGIAHRTQTARNNVAGKPVLWRPGHYARAHRHLIADAQRGANNSNWKGDNAKDFHEWLNTNYPRAGVCEECGERRRTDYANVTGHYTRNRSDYRELCRPCHTAFDFATGTRVRKPRYQARDERGRWASNR